jgi:hypothetical protein
MTPAYRKELLRLLAKTEQLISEREAVLADPASDEELLIASKCCREIYCGRWRVGPVKNSRQKATVACYCHQ